MPILSRLVCVGRRGARVVCFAVCSSAALISPITAAHAADPAAATTVAVDVEARFSEALAAYERNHWLQAYQMLAALADEGHGESARITLQMWRHGKALYRAEFHASARQVERWTRLWACSGDVTATGCTHAAMQTP